MTNPTKDSKIYETLDRNRDERFVGKELVSSKTVLEQLEVWIASEKGRKFVCARQYPHPGYAGDHYPDCEGCLIVAAALELKRAPVETSGWCPRCDCDYCGAMHGKVERAAVEPSVSPGCQELFDRIDFLASSSVEPKAEPLCDGEVRVIYEHGEPHGVRDTTGYLCFFNRVAKWPEQPDRYREEMALRVRQADVIADALRRAKATACPYCENGIPRVKADLHSDGTASWPCTGGNTKGCLVSPCQEPRVPLSQYCSIHMPRGAAQ